MFLRTIRINTLPEDFPQYQEYLKASREYTAYYRELVKKYDHFASDKWPSEAKAEYHRLYKRQADLHMGALGWVNNEAGAEDSLCGCCGASQLDDLSLMLDTQHGNGVNVLISNEPVKFSESPHFRFTQWPIGDKWLVVKELVKPTGYKPARSAGQGRSAQIGHIYLNGVSVPYALEKYKYVDEKLKGELSHIFVIYSNDQIGNIDQWNVWFKTNWGMTLQHVSDGCYNANYSDPRRLFFALYSKD